mmetsp:Transcript_3760/g.5657  ORF Transcript_3760/g.5657 Transcript_3760/m.5657 type:complete len:441 (+) Transcript_3760:235-1557(+)|eukprot:CAMPEP_0175097250 /NCGR_PEP_ID=MMETSP0086_2-20121207/5181_1 /TAXON_ID=136419 /ORGANISM="Unknown Unknown, Strain D1" /LENGTH=440 /DNA_ID=CAMNT_0016370737 /DNA_START=63 /DNA_END=1385 /DNA_ORIENTATION=+
MKRACTQTVLVTRKTDGTEGSLKKPKTGVGRTVTSGLPSWVVDQPKEFEAMVQYLSGAVYAPGSENVRESHPSVIFTEQSLPTLLLFMSMAGNEKVSFFWRDGFLVLHVDMKNGASKAFLKLVLADEEGRLVSGSVCQAMTSKFAAVKPKSWKKYNHDSCALLSAELFNKYLKKFSEGNNLCLCLTLGSTYAELRFVKPHWRKHPMGMMTIRISLFDDGSMEEKFEGAKTWNLASMDICPPSDLLGSDDEENVGSDGGFSEAETAFEQAGERKSGCKDLYSVQSGGHCFFDASRMVDPNLNYFRFVAITRLNDVLEAVMAQHEISTRLQDVSFNAAGKQWLMSVTAENAENSTKIETSLVFEKVLKNVHEADRDEVDDGSCMIFSKDVVDVMLKYVSVCRDLRFPETLKWFYDYDMGLFLSCSTSFAAFNIFLGSMVKAD